MINGRAALDRRLINAERTPSCRLLALLRGQPAEMIELAALLSTSGCERRRLDVHCAPDCVCATSISHTHHSGCLCESQVSVSCAADSHNQMRTIDSQQQQERFTDTKQAR